MCHGVLFVEDEDLCKNRVNQVIYEYFFHVLLPKRKRVRNRRSEGKNDYFIVMLRFKKTKISSRGVT